MNNMSYADELRAMNNASNSGPDIDVYVKKLHEFIKSECEQTAKWGYNRFGVSTANWVKDMLEDSWNVDENIEKIGGKFSKGIADDIKSKLEALLSEDGFTSVTVRMKRTSAITQTTYEEVEYTTGEKVFGGVVGLLTGEDMGNSYMKAHEKVVGYLYYVECIVTW
jgi:hypothetical protein